LITSKEPLIKSSMSRVAGKIVMIARSATKVVAGTTMPRSATPRAHDLAVPRNCAALRFAATRKGTGFAGCLLRCAPCEGGQPFAASHALHPIPQNQVRGHVGLNQRFLNQIKRADTANSFNRSSPQALSLRGPQAVAIQSASHTTKPPGLPRRLRLLAISAQYTDGLFGLNSTPEWMAASLVLRRFQPYSLRPLMRARWAVRCSLSVSGRFLPSKGFLPALNSILSGVPCSLKASQKVRSR